MLKFKYNVIIAVTEKTPKGVPDIFLSVCRM